MEQNQPPKPAGATGTKGVSDLKRTAEEAATTAKEHAVRAGEELRAAAGEQMEAAKETVARQSAAAKDTTASEMSRTASALRKAAEDLEADQAGKSRVPQSLLREAANGLGELSRTLEGKSVGEMIGDISEFGRRNPVAFMGAAALAGFALGRFARASEPDAASPATASPGRGTYRPETAMRAPSPATSQPVQPEPVAGRTPSPSGGSFHG